MTLVSQFGPDWLAVSPLLDELLNLPVHEREPWLESLTGDRSLHRDALRLLHSQHAVLETGSFLEAPPAIELRDASVPTAGADVGVYRLMAQIGEGGMGTVWLAERTDALTKRRVALKLPRVVWGNAFVERLAREREILATLEHENIARLYDAGIDAHGRPFLAMELVEGEPLDVYCRSRSLSVRERIALLLQVMAAVGHAHARLIVHRDLKPNNILVTRDGKVKLLDFGVAKLLEGDTTHRTALTELGGRALTLDYASPEQIRGDPLGTASDVYSLGVVAYELLADVKPYRLKRGSAAEMEEAILNIEPARASDAAQSTASKKALRGDLDAILGRALKKQVAERYPTVDAFAQDLHRQVRGEPVQARPDSARYRVRKFIGRHRVAVAMTSALTASIVAGSVVSIWQARVARTEERHATIEAARQTAVRDLYRETQSRLTVMGVEHPDMLSKPGTVTTTLLDKLAEMAPRYAGRPQERAAQLESVMLQLNYDGLFEESLKVGQEYLAQLIADRSGPAPIILAHGTLGSTLFQLGRWDESEAMRRAGLNWAPDVHDATIEKMRVDIATDLGGILIARGKRADALAVLEQAEVILAHVSDPGALRYALTNKFGLAYLGFDNAKALQYMRRARAEMLADGSADGDQRTYNANLLAGALSANGATAEAEALLQGTLDTVRREFGRNSGDATLIFSLFAASVARQNPARALGLIAEERRALEAEPAGISAAADVSLRANRLDALWLAGDTTAAMAVEIPSGKAPTTTPALRKSRFLAIARSRALLLAGRAPDALRLMQPLAANWPERGMPTAFWLTIQQVFAEAQLASGASGASSESGGALMKLLDREGGTAGSAYRCATALTALALVRDGRRDAAGDLLVRLERGAPPPFPSKPERADCELRRAQALSELGRAPEAAAIAAAVMPDLAEQDAGSPRLALARQLVAVKQ